MHVRYNEAAKYFETKTSDGPPEVWAQLDLSGQTSVAAANWPIGSVFITNKESGGVPINPNTLLGFGTWARVGGGRTLVDVDTGQTEFNTVEKTGGAKTHTLTATEMPVHTHTQNSHNHTQDSHNHTQNSHNHTQNQHTHTQSNHTHQYFAGASHGLASGSDWTGSGTSTVDTGGAQANISGATATNQSATATNIAATATNQAATATNQNAGGDGAHNNLQPYITFYIWKRTA